MLIQSYVCDGCGHSQNIDHIPNKPDNFPAGYRMMYTLTLTMKSGYDGLTSYGPIIHQVLWCEPCCAKSGIRLARPSRINPTPPSLEDILRDMIREEATEAAIEVMRNR